MERNMLDFAFSVPPDWMTQDQKPEWGLSRGFNCRRPELALNRAAGQAASNDEYAPATPLNEAHGKAYEWAGLADVAQSFARMWDEIDYGVMLLSCDAQLLYANHAARAELDARTSLKLVGYAVAACQTLHQPRLMQGIEDATRGRRALQEFGPQEDALPVSFLPVDGGRLDMNDAPHQRVMAIMGKRAVCEKLSFMQFAKLHALSPAEAATLMLACEGHSASQIALQHGVAVSTVRTQLAQVRQKTGARRLRDLMRRVAGLPPIIPAVK
jgi:DNA-binding CsgD family transcriptional regulator